MSSEIKVNDRRGTGTGFKPDPAQKSPFDLLSVEIGKLSPKPGDVLVVRLARDSDPEFIGAVSEYVSQALQGTGAKWIGLFEGVEIEHMSAADMAQLGWVRQQ